MLRTRIRAALSALCNVRCSRPGTVSTAAIATLLVMATGTASADCATPPFPGGNPNLSSLAEFDTPAAAWGNWTRSDAGIIHVFWQQFDSFVPVSATALPDTDPDVARIGVLDGETGAVLIPREQGAVISGGGAGGNVYNLPQVNDIQVLLQPGPEHVTGPVTVTLQLHTLGETFDPASVTLDGLAWDSREILCDRPFSNENGDGTERFERYTWSIYQLPDSAAPYNLEMLAEGTSNSLAALAVDIGPAAPVGAVPGAAPEQVPALPPFFSALGVLAILWRRARR